MSRYLDPKADIVFKKIFGEHPHLLKSFLNAVLPLSPEGEIDSLEYLSNEQVPPIPEMKRTIADVRCKDKQGRYFIVEMQVQWTDSFKQRLLFESSQAFVKQIKPGENYHLLQPVYGLGLIATIFEAESSEWYHHYKIVNIQKPHRMDVIEQLQLVFVELPKFPIHSPQEKQLRLLWLRFLREINEQTREVSTELLSVPEISEAVKLAEESAYSPGELRYYESYWDQVSRDKTLLSASYEEGKTEGRAEGHAEGRVAGKLEGERLLLQRLLSQKFGMLSEHVLQAITLANADELLKFSDAMLEAKTLDDIFK